MNEKVNTSLHSISLALVFALVAWYFIAADIAFGYLLTLLIVGLIIIEIISLSIISRVYPESHTSFKIGIIATLFILLGIKSMLPPLFVPISIAVIAINFLYNFYTNSKRRKGSFKRKKSKRRRF